MANRHGKRGEAAALKDAAFERAIQHSQELNIKMDCEGTDLTHDGCTKLLAGVRDLQAGVQTLRDAQVRHLLICNKFPETVLAFIGNRILDKLVVTQTLKKVHDTLIVILERKLTTMKTAVSATTATGAAATAAQRTSPHGDRAPPPPTAASGAPRAAPQTSAHAAEQEADSAAREHRVWSGEEISRAAAAFRNLQENEDDAVGPSTIDAASMRALMTAAPRTLYMTKTNLMHTHFTSSDTHRTAAGLRTHCEPTFQILVILAILTLATSPLRILAPCHNFGI